MMTRKMPREIAALIVAKAKPKRSLADNGPYDADIDDEDEEDGEPDEHLRLLAGDAFEALKNDDEESFAEALVTLVKSCNEGR